jgi:hypothetical protein
LKLAEKIILDGAAVDFETFDLQPGIFLHGVQHVLGLVGHRFQRRAR